MTDERRPDDELLSDRIRRSMAHYTFNPPLPERRPASGWRWPALVAAAAGGALAATLVISLLGGLPRSPVGNVTPTPIASMQPPSPSASVAPAFTEEEAAAACRGHSDIADDWLRPGERRADVAERLRLLPLLHSEEIDGDAVFVYADDRFNIICELSRGLDGELLPGIFTGLREAHGGGLEYSGGSTSPGRPDGTPPRPDMLMYGTAAPRFERVEIVMADGGARPAWIGEGIWFAWWKDPIDSVAIRGYAADGTVSTIDEGLRFVPVAPEETPQPTPWPGLPQQFDGVHDACATASTDVPQEWIRPDELRGQVLQRIRRLPLLTVDIRDFAASYFFADSRFVIECRIYRAAPGAEPEVSVLRTLREDPGDGLVYSFGSARGPVSGRPADMLMVGSAAPRLERVEVVLEDGSLVPAYVQDGMWIAWWNLPLSAVEVRGYDRNAAVTSILAGLELPAGSGG